MNDKLKKLKDKVIDIKDFVVAHGKIVMPIALLVCVGITVLIAVSINQKDSLQDEAQALLEQNASVGDGTALDSMGVTPQYELEENAHPEITNIVKTYYKAQVDGDIDTISKLNSYLNDIEVIRVKELSKYIEDYTEINVYTKPGLSENTYVTYVASKVKFKDLESPIAGFQTYYAGKDSDGNDFITEGTYDDTVYEYISNVTVQPDVVELNNRVVVDYNNLLAENPEVNEYVAYLKEKVNEEVGEILAKEEAPTPSPTPASSNGDDNQNQTSTSVVNKVRVKEKVNIRKSDSTGADKLGSASAGEEFTLIEKQGNGWTKIEYNGGEAFINSDYVEDVETVTVEIKDNNTENNNSNTGANNNSNSDAKPTNSTEVKGKVTVNDSGVRIRKEPNTKAEVLGTVYTGDKLDFIETTGDWTKVKYKKEYGYIKSEFVDKN